MIKYTLSKNTIITSMLLILLVMMGINQYLLFTINSNLKVAPTGATIATQTTTTTTQAETTEQTGTGDIVQQIYDEVVPKEGSDSGYELTFSTNGLNTLVGYARSIELTDEENQRYIKIGTSPDTACEYCCGINERGSLRDDGNIACGCAHNIGLTGLIKYLIQKGYTDDQILEEIQKWKAYFFPKGYVTEVIQERGINPESVGLPTQRGGC